MNDFSQLSQIRRDAYKLCQADLHKEENKKLLNQIIGINTVKKEWLDLAIKNYDFAQKSTGFKKVTLLQNALTHIYACEYSMKNSGFQDNDIIRLKDKIENSYLSTAIEFVETYIHHEKTLLQNFDILNSAVSVLQENNSKLANQYKIILNRSKSMFHSMQKVQNTLEINPLDLSENDFKQIRNIIKLHENSLRITPNLKEEILEDLRSKLDQLLLYYQKQVSEEEKQGSPSLKKINEYYDSFEKYYLPFKDMLTQKRYSDFIDKKKAFARYIDFLDQVYPQLLEIYNYYSLPRKITDKNKIFSALDTAGKFMIFQETSFHEINSLNPSLETMHARFKEILADEYKEDVVNYLKIENELINAEDNEDKISELVRFIKHLNQKLNSDKNHFLFDKFVKLRDEMLINFDNSLQSFLKKNIPQSNKFETIRISFDFVLNKLYELGDLERIEKIQLQKKQVFKAFNELEQWLCEIRDDYSVLVTLPDSNLKYSLQENIRSKIEAITELLPLIKQFNLQNVTEIAILIDDYSKKISSEKNNSDLQKLIILDNFSMKNYIVFHQKFISIGRESANDIQVNCDWISSKHCYFDVKNNTLNDDGSTNGTCVSSKSGYIKSEPISRIESFNLASSFEFSLKDSSSFFVFKLLRITDKDLLRNPDYKDIIQSLFNTEFICLKDSKAIYIDKESGLVSEHSDDNTDYIAIKPAENSYFISDANADIVESKNLDFINNKSERFSYHLN